MEFVNYDDPQYVYENPHVRNGLSLHSIRWAFSALHGDVSYWHPLTWLSHQIDCHLLGLRAGAHHLTSVWIHVGNALLLFAVLREMKLGRRTPFFVAGIFGLYPLHVESVAWIVERKDVLYGFFWLSALYQYLPKSSQPAKIFLTTDGHGLTRMKTGFLLSVSIRVHPWLEHIGCGFAALRLYLRAFAETPVADGIWPQSSASSLRLCRNRPRLLCRWCCS